MTANILHKVTMSSSWLQYYPNSVAMKFSVCLLVVVLFSLFVDLALTGNSLGDSVIGSRFLNTFNFQAIGDPTYGTVFVFCCVPALFLSLMCFNSRTGTMSMRALSWVKNLWRTPATVLLYAPTTWRDFLGTVLDETLFEPDPKNPCYSCRHVCSSLPNRSE